VQFAVQIMRTRRSDSINVDEKELRMCKTAVSRVFDPHETVTEGLRRLKLQCIGHAEEHLKTQTVRQVDGGYTTGPIDHLWDEMCYSLSVLKREDIALGYAAFISISILKLPFNLTESSKMFTVQDDLAQMLLGLVTHWVTFLNFIPFMMRTKGYHISDERKVHMFSNSLMGMLSLMEEKEIPMTEATTYMWNGMSYMILSLTTNQWKLFFKLNSWNILTRIREWCGTNILKRALNGEFCAVNDSRPLCFPRITWDIITLLPIYLKHKAESIGLIPPDIISTQYIEEFFELRSFPHPMACAKCVKSVYISWHIIYKTVLSREER